MLSLHHQSPSQTLAGAGALLAIGFAAGCALAAQTNGVNTRGGASDWKANAAKTYGDRGAEFCRAAEWDNAITNLNQAISLDPRDDTAYGYRGAAYVAKGELDKALQDFTEAVRLNPSGAYAYCNRASVYRIKGQFDKALADLDKCLHLDPTNDVAYKTRASIFNALGEFNRAIEDWNEGLRLSPDDASARAMRGHAYFRKGQFHQALRDYEEAIRLDPKSDQALNALAWLRATCPDASMRNGKAAVEAATNACELTAWKDWTRVDTLAAALAEAGDFEKAAEHERQAIATDGPSASELSAMQARLLLYERHKPYRDFRGPAERPSADHKRKRVSQ